MREATAAGAAATEAEPEAAERTEHAWRRPSRSTLCSERRGTIEYSQAGHSVTPPDARSMNHYAS